MSPVLSRYWQRLDPHHIPVRSHGGSTRTRNITFCRSIGPAQSDPVFNLSQRALVGPGSERHQVRANFSLLGLESGARLPGAPSTPFPPFRNLHLGTDSDAKRPGPENPPFMKGGRFRASDCPVLLRLTATTGRADRKSEADRIFEGRTKERRLVSVI